MTPPSSLPSPAVSPPPGRRGRLIAVVAWLYLICAIAGWGLLYAGDLWWPATLFLLSPRWLLTLPAVVLLPLAAWGRRRLVPLVILAGILMLVPVSGFCIPWGSLISSPPNGARLRILTCNLHYHVGDAPLLDALIDQVRPDIIAVQEWESNDQPAPLRGQGWWVDWRESLFLASRFPIRSGHQLGRDSEEPEGAVARYDIDTSSGVIHLFSLHLQSPRQGVYEALRKGRGGERVEVETDLRRTQSEQVAREAARVPDPILLVGDFNTPPQSALWRQVWGPRYRDAFEAAGWGWGYTFHGGRTSVRIDHIVVGQGWYVDRCWVGPRVESPHLPVIAELIWADEPRHRR
jgi:endonuclease/exonuclease/phosphatase (EEP) superfamily protein YafD